MYSRHTFRPVSETKIERHVFFSRGQEGAMEA